MTGHLRISWLVAGLAALAACAPGTPGGRASYGELCAGCHGSAGKGDGPAGAGLSPPPADLTRIAARNGGSFPRRQVMARIDGYARGQPHRGAMPAFWPLLEGRTVLVDLGDGVLTPTPEPLVALAEYIESLQE